MRTDRVIHVVHCHAEGEVGDVIVGGVATPPGATLWEQSRFIAQDDQLRRLMLNEPRGGVFRHVNLVVPAVDPDADAGFIIMEPEDTPPMSGSNALCVGTVLLETGQVADEGEARVILEAPAGTVLLEGHYRGDTRVGLSLTNVPSFVERRDEVLRVDGIGDVRVDTAFGGDSFVIVRADDLDIDITSGNARQLAVLGRRICDAANEQWEFDHPTLPDWNHFSFTYFVGPLREEAGILTSRNACAINPGKIDRSPTGTGCSALLALLHDREEISAGQSYRARSIIDSTFECAITEVGSVGSRPAVTPRITGRAWIYGTSQYFVDPEDPWPVGYRLSDTWPMDSPDTAGET